jgi:hypothetical protein
VVTGLRSLVTGNTFGALISVDVVFFFFGELSQPGDKKKWLANPIKGFLRFLKTTFARS